MDPAGDSFLFAQPVESPKFVLKDMQGELLTNGLESCTRADIDNPTEKRPFAQRIELLVPWLSQSQFQTAAPNFTRLPVRRNIVEFRVEVERSAAGCFFSTTSNNGLNPLSVPILAKPLPKDSPVIVNDDISEIDALGIWQRLQHPQLPPNLLDILRSDSCVKVLVSEDRATLFVSSMSVSHL